MKRKIVAIGGGGYGKIMPDGKKYPYELAVQDKEIIRLTGKEKPNFLLLAHSQPLEKQEDYFKTMYNIYNKIYGCECILLRSNELTNNDKVQSLISWADIIFECGGNTLDMIDMWKKTGFDIVLKNAWENGKVMCGVSAGANCWFKACSSDSLKIKYGKEKPLIKVECLGFEEGVFIPHCDEEGRQEHGKELLKNSKDIGLFMSNCAALEIVDDKYRLIVSDASYHNIKAYGFRAYWEGEEYLQEKIIASSEFKPLKELSYKTKK